jgi:hypothetical protein
MDTPTALAQMPMARGRSCGRRERGQAEHDHADHQHPAAAEPVADHPEREQQPGERQRVGVDRPLQLALAGAQARRFRLGDRLQRDVQHRVVQHDGHEAENEHAEDYPPAALNGLLIHAECPSA